VDRPDLRGRIEIGEQTERIVGFARIGPETRVDGLKADLVLDSKDEPIGQRDVDPRTSRTALANVFAQMSLVEAAPHPVVGLGRSGCRVL
jgi:hypothetical protein